MPKENNKLNIDTKKILEIYIICIIIKANRGTFMYLFRGVNKYEYRNGTRWYHN